MFLHLLSCVIMSLIPAASTLAPTEPPLIPKHPFVTVWNARTERCQHLDIPLDTAAFQAVTTPASVPGQFLTIFYEDRLGLYPKIDPASRTRREGGVPQNGNLTAHLLKARRQIDHYIAEDESPGLAVIDWESWRPLWAQNWGSKRIYQKLSMANALQASPFLSLNEISQLAVDQFQRAGRSFMERTIQLGVRERPSRRWGFYLFPYCYNYNWDRPGYTGRCSAKKERNDELSWLWNESTALYPSIYLEAALRDSAQARLFVRHRLVEAARVSRLANGSYAVPVYPYVRPVYKDSKDEYMSEMDLVSTIGEAAALGAAGVISWGDMDVTDSEDSCFDARRHLEDVMNPYILNVSTASEMCSDALCQNRGRCVRKRWDDDVYLHLDPRRHRIQRRRRGGPLAVIGGGLSQDDVDWFDRHFDCMCYDERPCRSTKDVNAVQDNRYAKMTATSDHCNWYSQWELAVTLTSDHRVWRRLL
uniref:Hyaluronidase n=1 Tax=Hippocampus comes TaxID=109280 RepID=A0A3Q2XU96_HIPCM